MQTVYRLEIGHQRGNSRLQTGFLRRLGYAALMIAGLAALWVILLEIGLGSFLMRTLPVRQPDMRQTTFTLFFVIPFAVLAPITIIFHFYTLIRTVIYAASAIAREKENGTWEPLVLTRLNAWQILLGKAWATSAHLLPIYLLLGFLRYSALLCFSMTEARSFPEFAYNRYWFPSEGIPVDLLFTIALSMVIFTLINLPLTVAFGLLGGLLNWKNAIPFAFVLRAAALVLIGLSMMAGGSAFLRLFAPVSEIVTFQDNSGNTIGSYNPNAPQVGTLEYYIGTTLRDVGVTLIDNGTTIHKQWIIAQNSFYIAGDTNRYAIFSIHTILVSLAVYAVMTFAVLFTARRVAIRQGGI